MELFRSYELSDFGEEKCQVDILSINQNSSRNVYHGCGKFIVDGQEVGSDIYTKDTVWMKASAVNKVCEPANVVIPGRGKSYFPEVLCFFVRKGDGFGIKAREIFPPLLERQVGVKGYFLFIGRFQMKLLSR